MGLLRDEFYLPVKPKLSRATKGSSSSILVGKFLSRSYSQDVVAVLLVVAPVRPKSAASGPSLFPSICIDVFALLLLMARYLTF